MEDACSFGGPKPTIVGPRPDDATGLRKDVPRGMEKLLTLAGLSGEWRERVLADPISAAAGADIGLSPSERAILASVPRATLSSMADSFARKSGRPVLARMATGVAAAALLAVNLTASAADDGAASRGIRPDVPEPLPVPAAPTDNPQPTRGIRPDIPVPKPPDVTPPPPVVPPPEAEVPPLVWQDSLAGALAMAKVGNQAVMAIFPHPNPPKAAPKPPVPVHDGTRGIRVDIPEPTVEEKSQKAVLTDSQEFRKAVRDASVLAVKVTRPVPPPPEPETGKSKTPANMEALKRFRLEQREYEGALMKYGIKDTLPAIVFIAPDGSALSKLAQPVEEPKIVEGLKGVPPLLATWITNQRRRDDRIYKMAPGIPPGDPKIYNVPPKPERP